MEGKTDAHRRYDRYLFSMCGLAGLMYGIGVGLISAALPYIRATCDFTEMELSGIVAAVLLGGIPGKILAATVADMRGRLAAFRLTAIVFAVAVPLICFSGGAFWPMFLGRILQGVGCGLVGLASPLYMAECADAEDRGKGTGMIQLVLTVGLVVAAAVGFFVSWFYGSAASEAVSAADKAKAWQSIFWFSVLPAFFLFAGSFRLKESPRWLFKRGRRAEALDALLANHPAPAAELALAEMSRNAAAEIVTPANGEKAAKETLLQRKYLLPFALAFLIMCFTQATGINSILNYSVELFQRVGLADTSANIADTVIKFVNFLMTIVALALVDRRGRKFLLSVGTAGIVVGLSLVGATFLGLEQGWLSASVGTGVLVVLGFVVFIAFFGVGPGVCVWLADSELMPLRIRANGMMIAGLGNMTTSWVIAQIFLPWSKAFGHSSVFFTLAGISVFFFLTVLFLLPETKGRSLEEIERYFARKEG